MVPCFSKYASLCITKALSAYFSFCFNSCSVNYVNYLLVVTCTPFRWKKELISSSTSEADLGLLQHRRWSALLPAVNYYHKALHLGCCSSPRSAPGFYLPVLLNEYSIVFIFHDVSYLSIQG